MRKYSKDLKWKAYREAWQKEDRGLTAERKKECHIQKGKWKDGRCTLKFSKGEKILSAIGLGVGSLGLGYAFHKTGVLKEIGRKILKRGL